ncbi:MAG: hypothetical protein IKO22_05830 [Oscillospiraceae bacterium]|nr:hypothetical protein [Oscillospiraceae bacterium]
MFKKILFYLGVAVPFFFLPIQSPWDFIVMFVGIFIISVLPTIGSAVAIFVWIWAGIVVLSMPFSWFTVVFALFGLFCLIEFGYSFLSGIGAIK